MTVAHGFEGWPAGELHVAIGVFDGVHLGHRSLVARLVTGAHAARASALVATFDPLPARFLDPAGGPLALTEVDLRGQLLREAGADAVAVFTFNAAFAALTPEAFARRLAAAGTVRRVVVGPDFQFGHERSGVAGTLDALGARHGFAVEVVAPVQVDGAVVSSTRIRDLLAGEGDLTRALALLGHPYSVRGTVARGDGRGTTIGWPTLNLTSSPEVLLPKDGIYACWAEVGGTRHPAAVSLGVRPTFGAGLERRLEAHLIGFSDDLYGAWVRTTFIQRLRDEQHFDSVASLQAQIARDVKAAREALARHESERQGSIPAG